MELYEYKARMHSTEQPKLNNIKFQSYSVVTFQELRLVKAH